MKKLSLLTPILLVACATTVNQLSVSDQRSVASNLPAITAGSGQLCIARVGDMYTCNDALKFDFVDNYEKTIGDIRTGNEYFCANLTPGNHNITGNSKSSFYYGGAAIPVENRVAEEIQINAGTRTFFEIQCGNWGGGVKFVPVSNERGLIGIYHTDKYQKRYLGK